MKVMAWRFLSVSIKCSTHVSCFRHYFALPTNPGEQFFVFSSLAAWLIRKCGLSMESPQEYDDPNSTIAFILDSARSLVYFIKILLSEAFLFPIINNHMHVAGNLC